MGHRIVIKTYQWTYITHVYKYIWIYVYEVCLLDRDILPCLSITGPCAPVQTAHVCVCICLHVMIVHVHVNLHDSTLEMKIVENNYL